MDPILIVGAGIIGLTLGQGLKKVLVSFFRFTYHIYS